MELFSAWGGGGDFCTATEMSSDEFIAKYLMLCCLNIEHTNDATYDRFRVELFRNASSNMPWDAVGYKVVINGIEYKGYLIDEDIDMPEASYSIWNNLQKGNYVSGDISIEYFFQVYDNSSGEYVTFGTLSLETEVYRDQSSAVTHAVRLIDDWELIPPATFIMGA